MKLGVIGAMDVEVASIKEKMQIERTVEAARMTFCEGKIGMTDVVVVKCGVGKVNAALCVQILCDRFGVDAILNTGVAGSLNNDINVGDIVVADSVVYHDVDATVFGYAPGEVPSLGTREFPADEELSLLAVQAIRKAAPEIGVFRGKVASGDQFISEKTVKNRIRDTFHAQCCEMESTAIGHAAWINRIPFVIIRAISDKADEETLVTYDVFEKKAAHDCAEAVFCFIEEL